MMLSRSRCEHVNISYNVHVQPFAKEYLFWPLYVAFVYWLLGWECQGLMWSTASIVGELIGFQRILTAFVRHCIRSFSKGMVKEDLVQKEGLDFSLIKYAEIKTNGLHKRNRQSTIGQSLSLFICLFLLGKSQLFHRVTFPPL